MNSSFVSILSRHVCQNVTVSQCNQAAVGGSACRERKRKGYWLAKDKVELETFHGHDRAKNGVPVPCSLNSP